VVPASTITDRNGNQITKTAGGYQDALGREVISFTSNFNIVDSNASANTYPNPNPYTYEDFISIPGLGSITADGGTGSAIVHWKYNNPTFPVSGSVLFGSTNNTTSSIWGNTIPYAHCDNVDGGLDPTLTGAPAVPSAIPYPAISQIDIPSANGIQSYTFQYEPLYGHISRINFPDGGYVNYTWGLNLQSTASNQQYFVNESNPAEGQGVVGMPFMVQATCVIHLDLPAITERDVSYDGSSVALRQTFSYSTTWSSMSQWSSKTTTVWTYDLTKANPGTPVSVTTYTYGYVPADTAPFTTQSWLANQVPVEQKIVYADGNGNTLKTVYDTWLNSTTKLGEQTVLANGQGNAVERCYDANEQVTNVYEFGFQSQGAKPSDPLCYSNSIPISTATSLYSSQSLKTSSIGPLLRQTTTSYSPFFNSHFAPNYQSNAGWAQTTHIVNAPQIITVADGSGNPLKKTTFTYPTVAPNTSGAMGLASLPVVVNPATISACPPNETGCPCPQGNQVNTSAPCLTGNIGTMTQVSNNGGSPTTKYTWWDTGLLDVKTDPNNNPTTYSYNDTPYPSSFSTTNYDYDCKGAGPIHSDYAYLTSVTDALGYTKNFAWDYCSGLLTKATDENSKTTYYQYSDLLGRLTQVYYPDNPSTPTSGGNPSINVAYIDSPYSPSTNCTPNSTGTPNYTVTTLSTPNPSAVKETAFDGMGHALRTILTSDPSGADCVDTTYDGLGRVASVTNPYRAGDSPVGVTKYTYDALGRKIVQTQQDNTILKWCYDGIPATNPICHGFLGTNPKVPVGTWVDSADENGNDWQRNSNGLGQMTVVMEPGGTSQATPGLAPSMETDYAYDPLNNLLGVAQWGGSSNNSSNARLRSFSYDNLSQLLSALNPETGTVNYSYDLDGNVTSKTDARGISTSYQYDPLNRVISKTYPTDTSGTPISCFQYDTSSIPGATSGAAGNMIGRLSNAWIQATTTSCSGTAPNYAPATGSYLTLRSILAYDAMGRIQSENQYTPATIPSNTPYGLQYTYDLMGNLLTSTSGAGPGGTSLGTPFAFTYLYDGASHLATLQSSGTTNYVTGAANGFPQTLFNAQSGTAICPGSTFSPAAYTAFGGLQNATYGNCVLNLNRSYDALRLRLISEVDNGTGVTPGTSGSAAVTITGQEQSQ
jgi:YD repeat-containing protein